MNVKFLLDLYTFGMFYIYTEARFRGSHLVVQAHADLAPRFVHIVPSNL